MAVAATAGTKDGIKEPSIDDLLAFESKSDDIFANVPRAADSDVVRESTRFFVNAAGVNARKSKNKMAMVLGGAGAMCVVAFMGAWATGIISIEIPGGIGNPFAGMNQGGLFAGDDDEAEDEDPMKMKQALEEKKKKRKRRSPRTRRKRAGAGYVSDNPSGSSGRGARGDDAESIDLNLGGGGGSVGALPDVELPSAGVDRIVPTDGGDGLTERQITSVIASRKRSVHICYSQSLKGQENLRGKLEIRVTVAPTGRVSQARVQSSAFRGSRIGNCIVDKIKGWVFPRFSGPPQQVLVPFVLEGGG